LGAEARLSLMPQSRRLETFALHLYGTASWIDLTQASVLKIRTMAKLVVTL